MAGYYSLTFLLSDLDVEGMDVQIADQSGKPLQLPAAEKKVLCGFHYANIFILNIWTVIPEANHLGPEQTIPKGKYWLWSHY